MIEGGSGATPALIPMKVKALKSFISTRHGNVEAGEYLPDVPAGLALEWERAGMVETVKTVDQTYQTKVVREQPEAGDVPLDAGRASESGSSQAGQASPKRTRKGSRAKKQ